jgi:ABC-type transport system involved in multi-copper enzyme maturation permease subunit
MTTALTAPVTAQPFGGASLLAYRPYRGKIRGAATGVWAIARSGLRTIVRRKLFWGLYALSLMIFLFFFFGQYILSWLGANLDESAFRIGAGSMAVDPKRILELFRDQLKINGSGATYSNLIWYEGYVVMIVLALAGSALVGNDFRFGSLPFYLSKPLGRWHYVLGKSLTVAVFINAMTTLLALILWVEYGLLDSWAYFANSWRVAIGIVGYGAVLTLVLCLLLMATASWLRKTVPMIMVWTTLFVFARGLSQILMNVTGENSYWRLIDLWTDMYAVGCWLMQVQLDKTYPPAGAAIVVLGLLCAGCYVFLNRRIRAVEVV